MTRSTDRTFCWYAKQTAAEEYFQDDEEMCRATAIFSKRREEQRSQKEARGNVESC
jgi:hypothetical protein